MPEAATCCYVASQMTVRIPAERLGTVALTERDALVDIAIGLYKREEASLGRAAEVAGITSVELLDELGRRRIPVNFGAADLQADLARLKSLG